MVSTSSQIGSANLFYRMVITINIKIGANNTPEVKEEEKKKPGRPKGAKNKAVTANPDVSEYMGTYGKFPGGMFRLLDTSTLKIAKSDNVGLFNVRLEVPMSWDGEPEEIYILHAPMATFLKKRTVKEIADMGLKGTRSAITATELIKMVAKPLTDIIGKRRTKDE